MTIPISPVNIHPANAPPAQPPAWVAVTLQAIQQGRDLGLAWEKFRQEQREFEVRKGLIGEQTEAVKLQNKEAQQKLKDREDALTAQGEAHRLYVGSLPRRNFGETIAAIKDARVGDAFMDYYKQGLEIEQAIKNLNAPPAQQFTHVGQTPGGIPVNLETKSGSYQVGGPQLRDPDAGATRRIPVVTEREKASAAISTIRANDTITRIERTDPGIGARVANKAAQRKSIISGLMRRLAGTAQEDANLLAEAEIEKSMSPEELEYYVTGKQLLSGILPGLSGKQVTAREYVMHAPAYLSMGSSNPRVIKSRETARITRIRGFIAEAGEAMAERIAELQGIDLTPYGLGTVTLPDSTTMEITPGRARYHPKFNFQPGTTTAPRP